MALPLWFHAASLWYCASNAFVAYLGFLALPSFFAWCYGLGLLGGLGDHIQPYLAPEYHYYTYVMENVIGRFPIVIGVGGLLMKYFTLHSVSVRTKVLTFLVLAVQLPVAFWYHPVNYTTDWQFHLVHSLLVHLLGVFVNYHVCMAIIFDDSNSSKRQ